MNTITEHLEQENQALRQEVADLQRDVAAARRATADHLAEVKQERDDARAALDQVCARLTEERDARRGLAQDLARTNDQLQAAQATVRHLRIVELKARLAVIKFEEGTDVEEEAAMRTLREVLGMSRRR